MAQFRVMSSHLWLVCVVDLLSECYVKVKVLAKGKGKRGFV